MLVGNRKRRSDQDVPTTCTLHKPELVDVVQLDIFHDQQPHPRLCLGDDRSRRTLRATDLEDVDIEAPLVELVALGVPLPREQS